MRQCDACWITEDDGTGVKHCERCGRDWCEEHYFGHVCFRLAKTDATNTSAGVEEMGHLMQAIDEAGRKP